MEIKVISVMGAGQMGNGIAHVAALAGFKVYMRDIADEFVNKGMETIKKNMARQVKKGVITQEQMDAALERIIPTTNLEEALREADFVIEAIIENPNAKKELFKEASKICKKDTIFASNTSSISITEMAAVTDRPEKFIGMHFFNPVPVMKLVEIIKGAQTSEETYNITKELAEKMGKDTVTVNEAPGFAVNRVLMPFLLEAIFAVQEGVATIEDMDKAIKLGLNHPMGPFTLMDFIGNDTILYIADYMFEEFKDPKYKAPVLLRKMVRAGYLGRKTGKGWYDYS